MRPITTLLGGILLFLLPSPSLLAWDGDAEAAADADPAQKDQDEEKEGKGKRSTGARFLLRRHPSFRVGRAFRMDFRVKFQHDLRTFNPALTGDEGDVANLKKMRVGIEGTVFRIFEYEVEREIRNEVADLFNLRSRETHALWRDVYGNFRYFRRVQVKAGQFKLPFGMDQLYGRFRQDFVFRSLIGERLAPGRDRGIMLHGRLLDRGLQYQAGIFEHDGWKAHGIVTENGVATAFPRTGKRTFAARVTGTPFRLFRVPAPFKTLELGGAFTENPVNEGLNSLRGRSWVVTHNYFPRINVKGHRLRVGTELNWEPGPFGLKAEVIRVREERFEQGLRGNDLPDLIHRGWYFTTTWVITGEKKAGGVEPRKPFVWWGHGGGHGLGAIEVASRYEQIRHGSSEHIGLPSRSSRAANIAAASERVATFGVNWYLNRFMKIQFNGIRELIEDPERSPILGRNIFWSRYVRMQFVL